MGQRIAIVGSEAPGLGAAWALHRDHAVTVFEADSRIGGHSNTMDVPTDTGVTPIADSTSLVSTPALTVPPTVLLSARGWTPPLRGAGVELMSGSVHLLPPNTPALAATAVLEEHAVPGEDGT